MMVDHLEGEEEDEEGSKERGKGVRRCDPVDVWTKLGSLPLSRLSDIIFIVGEAPSLSPVFDLGAVGTSTSIYPSIPKLQFGPIQPESDVRHFPSSGRRMDGSSRRLAALGVLASGSSDSSFHFPFRF